MLTMTEVASHLGSSTSTAMLSTSTIFIPQPLLGAFLKPPARRVVRDCGSRPHGHDEPDSLALVVPWLKRLELLRDTSCFVKERPIWEVVVRLDTVEVTARIPILIHA